MVRRPLFQLLRSSFSLGSRGTFLRLVRFLSNFGRAPPPPQQPPKLEIPPTLQRKTRSSSSPSSSASPSTSSPSSSSTPSSPSSSAPRQSGGFPPLPEANRIVEVTPQNVQQVITSGIPVLLDCWAAWCQPCRQLEPILKDAVQQADGALMLAKLNVDEYPELAQAFQVTSLPTVFLIERGQMLDRFVGLPPPAQLSTFLSRAVARGRSLVSQDSQSGNNPQDILSQAGQALDQQDAQRAKQLYSQVLQNQEWSEHHVLATAGLAKAEAFAGNIAAATELIQKLRTQHREQVKSLPLSPLVNYAELLVECAKSKYLAEAEADLCKQLESDPNQHEIRYGLALRYCREGRLEECVENLLEIVKRQKSWNQEAASKTCIKLFDALGKEHPLTQKSRRKLTNLLFV